jgi:TPR repeat protein
MANDEKIQKAREHIESGDYKSALEILQPLIETNEAAALFLYSTFSISSVESDEEFERRSIKCLQTASEMGCAPAIYALGVCYDFGDMVEHDYGKAAVVKSHGGER